MQRHAISVFALFLPLLLLASCGRGKDCEQPTIVSSKLDNRTGRTLELGFEYWSGHQEKVETRLLTLQAQSVSQQKIEDSKYKKTTIYTGKVDFQGKDPECSATPEERSTSIFLNEASFQLVKACSPKYSASEIVLVEKTESCPEEMIEQKRPGYPKSAPSSETSTSTSTSTGTN